MDTIEQDKQGGDELPTYEALLAQNGPNSRFGRWQGWIEKRAAERQQNITEEDRARQRARGWGNDMIPMDSPPRNLRVETGSKIPSPAYGGPKLTSEPPLVTESPPFVGQTLAPTHLKLNQFGSRFLPHTTRTLRCLLPLPGERFLLIGHDGGLSVLDLFPQESNEGGETIQKNPTDAKVIPIWYGETVYQMSLLETDKGHDGTLQGVILALVGPHPENSHNESLRSIRMYTLANITSLTHWSAAQEGKRPLDLQGLANGGSSSPSRRHRAQASVTKGLKSILEGPEPLPTETSSHPILKHRPPDRPPPARDDSWDLIDDWPLRWATSFVPLAAPGSRLANTPVISYTLWRDENGFARGATLLAVITKCNVFLYEASKGERAFRFVKDFYVPTQPRSVSFIIQCVDTIQRRTTDVSTPKEHRRSESTNTLRKRNSSSGQRTYSYLTYDPQLNLFVIFEKKAGWIRIADSAVGEVQLYDEGWFNSLKPYDSNLHHPKSFAFERESKVPWIPPTWIELPLPSTSAGSSSPPTKHVYILTKGKHTHIVPFPLPAMVHATPPLGTIGWQSTPSSVCPRLCDSADGPFLQLVAFGEDGVEVQELSLSFLSKGKGKACSLDFRTAQADVGGGTNVLCAGGNWHRQNPSHLSRSASIASQPSFDSVSSEQMILKYKAEQGIYASCCKGLGDWRVFWVGGDGRD